MANKRELLRRYYEAKKGLPKNLDISSDFEQATQPEFNNINTQLEQPIPEYSQPIESTVKSPEVDLNNVPTNQQDIVGNVGKMAVDQAADVAGAANTAYKGIASMVALPGAWTNQLIALHNGASPEAAQQLFNDIMQEQTSGLETVGNMISPKATQVIKEAEQKGILSRGVQKGLEVMAAPFIATEYAIDQIVPYEEHPKTNVSLKILGNLAAAYALHKMTGIDDKPLAPEDKVVKAAIDHIKNLKEQGVKEVLPKEHPMKYMEDIIDNNPNITEREFIDHVKSVETEQRQHFNDRPIYDEYGNPDNMTQNLDRDALGSGPDIPTPNQPSLPAPKPTPGEPMINKVARHLNRLNNEGGYILNNYSGKFSTKKVSIPEENIGMDMDFNMSLPDTGDRFIGNFSKGPNNDLILTSEGIKDLEPGQIINIESGTKNGESIPLDMTYIIKKKINSNNAIVEKKRNVKHLNLNKEVISNIPLDFYSLGEKKQYYIENKNTKIPIEMQYIDTNKGFLAKIDYNIPGITTNKIQKKIKIIDDTGKKQNMFIKLIKQDENGSFLLELLPEELYKKQFEINKKIKNPLYKPSQYNKIRRKEIESIPLQPLKVNSAEAIIPIGSTDKKPFNVDIYKLSDGDYFVDRKHKYTKGSIITIDGKDYIVVKGKSSTNKPTTRSLNNPQLGLWKIEPLENFIQKVRSGEIKGDFKFYTNKQNILDYIESTGKGLVVQREPIVMFLNGNRLTHPYSATIKKTKKYAILYGDVPELPEGKVIAVLNPTVKGNYVTEYYMVEDSNKEKTLLSPLNIAPVSTQYTPKELKNQLQFLETNQTNNPDIKIKLPSTKIKKQYKITSYKETVYIPYKEFPEHFIDVQDDIKDFSNKKNITYADIEKGGYVPINGKMVFPGDNILFYDRFGNIHIAKILDTNKNLWIVESVSIKNPDKIITMTIDSESMNKVIYIKTNQYSESLDSYLNFLKPLTLSDKISNTINWFNTQNNVAKNGKMKSFTAIFDNLVNSNIDANKRLTSFVEKFESNQQKMGIKPISLEELVKDKESNVILSNALTSYFENYYNLQEDNIIDVLITNNDLKSKQVKALLQTYIEINKDFNKFIKEVLEKRKKYLLKHSTGKKTFDIKNSYDDIINNLPMFRLPIADPEKIKVTITSKKEIETPEGIFAVGDEVESIILPYDDNFLDNINTLKINLSKKYFPTTSEDSKQSLKSLQYSFKITYKAPYKQHTLQAADNKLMLRDTKTSRNNNIDEVFEKYINGYIESDKYYTELSKEELKELIPDSFKKEPIKSLNSFIDSMFKLQSDYATYKTLVNIISPEDLSSKEYRYIKDYLKSLHSGGKGSVVNNIINNMLFTKYIGLKIFSPIRNLFQVSMLTRIKLHNDIGIKATEKAFLNLDARTGSLRQLISNLKSPKKFYETVDSIEFSKDKELDAKIKQGLKELYKRGHFNSTLDTYYRGEKDFTDKISKVTGDIATFTGQWFGASDTVNRLRTAIVGLYGYKGDINKTQQLIHDTQFLYTKENKPLPLAKSPWLNTFLMFSSYPINQMGLLWRTSGAKEFFTLGEDGKIFTKERGKALGKLAIGAGLILGVFTIFAGLDSIPGTNLVPGLPTTLKELDKSKKGIDYREKWTKTVGKFLSKLPMFDKESSLYTADMLYDIMKHGVPATFGINLSSMINIAVPYLSRFGQSDQPYKNAVKSLLGVAGDTFVEISNCSGDAACIIHAVNNMLGNIAKYTPGYFDTFNLLDVSDVTKEEYKEKVKKLKRLGVPKSLWITKRDIAITNEGKKDPVTDKIRKVKQLLALNAAGVPTVNKAEYYTTIKRNQAVNKFYTAKRQKVEKAIEHDIAYTGVISEDTMKLINEFNDELANKSKNYDIPVDVAFKYDISNSYLERKIKRGLQQFNKKVYANILEDFKNGKPHDINYLLSLYDRMSAIYGRYNYEWAKPNEDKIIKDIARIVIGKDKSDLLKSVRKAIDNKQYMPKFLKKAYKNYLDKYKRAVNLKYIHSSVRPNYNIDQNDIDSMYLAKLKTLRNKYMEYFKPVATTDIIFTEPEKGRKLVDKAFAKSTTAETKANDYADFLDKELDLTKTLAYKKFKQGYKSAIVSDTDFYIDKSKVLKDTINKSLDRFLSHPENINKDIIGDVVEYSRNVLNNYKDILTDDDYNSLLHSMANKLRKYLKADIQDKLYTPDSFKNNKEEK